ncbi:hypothetical protein SAMD00019534_077710, partial [Acytostelium subglobosum LB1]|uniref:hypothetical protein n=1 Tax=Acytostelium subglobosum LB1 TaxID=1410327 RepID=UPI000644AD42
MGNQGAKKRKQQNEKEIMRLQIAILSVNVVYIIYRYWYHGDTFTLSNYFLYAATVILTGIPYLLISTMAKVTNNAEGELIDGGADLSAKGLVEYYFDSIYISLLVLLLGLLSDKAFLILLVIPGFAGYQIWVKFLGPWFFSGDNKETEYVESKSKRQEKMEKRRDQNKVRYVR